VGSSTINWEIEVTNSCGSDTISGSFNPCNQCTASIQDIGCTTGSTPLDVLFLVDGSTSFQGQQTLAGPPCISNGSDFPNALSAIRSTINDLESSNPGAHRFAMAEFSENLSDIIGAKDIHFGYPSQASN